MCGPVVVAEGKELSCLTFLVLAGWGRSRAPGPAESGRSTTRRDPGARDNHPRRLRFTSSSMSRSLVSSRLS